ncbi:MAG: substrate-binding domain-containing protein [Clostridia bacterium]|nr:substrate-binding domain-containing protein [Clostridia bacterium]
MKKARCALCWAVILLCLPGIFISAGRLPPDNRPLVAKKYGGWSGVVRIWAFEGWSDGASGWVRRCAAAFEKAHGGVYIEIKSVGAEDVRALGREGVLPPDMVLFPPGLMDGVSGLAPVGSLPVRGSLLGAGQGFAAPAALGGYGWAVNEAAEGAAVPADEEWRRWSRAAAALGEPEASIEEIEFEPPGIDLGLPASSSISDPMKEFMNGRLGAVMVTQKEIARLNRLSDQGRGPEWTLRPGTWTDQILYMAVPANGGERQRLAMEFLHHLLSDECQRQLTYAGLFPVTDAAAGYAPGSAMERMDAALRSDRLQAVPAFLISPER